MWLWVLSEEPTPSQSGARTAPSPWAAPQRHRRQWPHRAWLPSCACRRPRPPVSLAFFSFVLRRTSHRGLPPFMSSRQPGPHREGPLSHLPQKHLWDSFLIRPTGVPCGRANHPLYLVSSEPYTRPWRKGWNQCHKAQRSHHLLLMFTSLVFCPTCEGNDAALSLFRLTYLTQRHVLRVLPCCCQWPYSILSRGRAVFRCVYGPRLLHPVL